MKSPPWSVREFIVREEIVDVTGEIRRRPETIGHHVDEVEQFKPFGRIRKSLVQISAA